jgi:hypothetical protein
MADSLVETFQIGNTFLDFCYIPKHGRLRILARRLDNEGKNVIGASMRELTLAEWSELLKRIDKAIVMADLDGANPL